MSYSDLTETEQHYWDEYGTLRAITDWAGFTDAQDNRKRAARDWLVNQRKEIWRCAEGKKQCAGGAGWNVNNRQARYDTLKDESLNTATAKHEYTLPANGCTDTEKSYIEEREGYLMIGGDGASADDAQKKRKTANSDWLVSRRKQVWHLGEDEGWDEAERELRYDNLCIATHYGSPWDAYEKSHNKYGQAIHEDTGSSGKGRDACKDWLNKYVGVTENPKGSNKGSPQPTGWQNRVYGDDGVPWCACFAVCSAWDSGVKGSGTASVCNNRDLAKRGEGIYRGWTSDPSRVRPGDHMFIGCDHTGVAYGTLQNDGTILGVEGNTSGTTSGGSQWNGDLVAKKARSAGYWNNGFGLVDFPD
jgi:hypothetical protein